MKVFGNHRRSLLLLTAVALSLSHGCTGSSEGGDAGLDDDAALDGGQARADAGSSVSDDGGPRFDAGAPDGGAFVPDAGPEADAGAEPDAGGGRDGGHVDGGADPYAGQPLGQCVVDDDCPVGPQGQQCSTALPGGACLGCGDDGDCPGAAACSPFGACVTECSEDLDCPPGLRCGGSGECRARSCVDGACPVPLFVCNDSDLCARASCSGGEACPASTTCVDGTCIEDRALQAP